jgi:hypothetical protein
MYFIKFSNPCTSTLNPALNLPHLENFPQTLHLHFPLEELILIFHTHFSIRTEKKNIFCSLDDELWLMIMSMQKLRQQNYYYVYFIYIFWCAHMYETIFLQTSSANIHIRHVIKVFNEKKQKQSEWASKMQNKY